MAQGNETWIDPAIDADPQCSGERSMHVYADGYGRWHAVNTPSESMAADAIATAIWERQNGPWLDVFNYVIENIIELDDEPGHYVEYGIE